MKVGTRIASLIVVMIMLSLVLPSNWLKEVEACTCAIPGTVSEELEQSDVVFDGIVVSGERASLQTTDVIWTIEPTGIWKGTVKEKLEVESAESSDSCGFEFKEGKRYVVFAKQGDNGLITSRCSLTTAVHDQSQILQDLGPYEVILERSSSIENLPEITQQIGTLEVAVKQSSYEENANWQSGKVSSLWAVGVILIIFIAGIFLYIRRKSKR